jgi:chemotaxis protein MotC
MRALLLAAILALSATCARADAPAPYRLIRALLELQNQIANGKASARVEQPRLLAEINRQFASAPTEVWLEPRNARAAVLFTLSGGSARGMRQILQKGGFAQEEFKLARGALAYAEGHADKARELLMPIDARRLEPALGGQLALVQAALVLPADREKAIELLGLARLLSPGTLVEETALRRQISVVGQIGDADRFADLAHQYARRFKQSLYAQEFRESFTASLVRLGITVSADKAAALEPILSTFEPDERCRLAILIARTTLLDGAFRSTDVFSEMVMRPPVDQSCEVMRARLYRAASHVTEPNVAAHMLVLESIDPARLTAEDESLRQAALAMGKLVSSWPESKAPGAGDTAQPALRGTSLLADAQNALRQSDTLLRSRP